VVDAAGVDRFPLLGISQGCAVSAAYAGRHPERASHLILYGGFAVGGKKNDSPLIRLGWGADNPAFRQIFTGLFMPGAGSRWISSTSCNAGPRDPNAPFATGKSWAISTCATFFPAYPPRRSSSS
jgi:pimeloyl-ACP methyl ester carboxylesterase